MRKCLFFLIASLALIQPSFADEEAANWTHVVTSRWGKCYAKSVPKNSYGADGITEVYRVQKEEDDFQHTHNWFSQQIYLECFVSDDKTPVGISLVRLGPWPRGQKANSHDLALAFYYKGEPVKKYTTLDIAGSQDNVSLSSSHYTVIEKVMGYRWIKGNQYSFDVVTADGRTLSFDPVTGSTIGQSDKSLQPSKPR